jgi:predicted nucleic acid-binding protein
MNAVDTNVLIYAQDPRDPRKRAIAEGLLASLADGLPLWQVACEYVATSRKLSPFGLSQRNAIAHIGRLRRIWNS